MKYVVKQKEPREFTDWKSLANEDWKPAYSNLPGEIKKAVKEALMTEQGFICCYCERQLIYHDSHVEHLRPQSDPLGDPLDFGNMLCSCQNQLKKGEPRHCGNLKDDWYDPSSMVSPLKPGCESRFAFGGDGTIKPSVAQDNCAAETIKRLGLDIPKLTELRAKAIEPFLDESLSTKDFQTFVTGYLARDRSGRFSEFWTTIRHLFGEVVAA